MGIVVGIDTAGSKDTDVNATLLASVGQVESTDDIAADGGSFVVFTPVDVRTTCAACTVEHVCGLDSVQLLNDCFSVLHANGGGVDALALIFEQGLKVTSNPAVTTPDQEHILALRRHHGE